MPTPFRSGLRLLGARAATPYLLLGYGAFLVLLAVWSLRTPPATVGAIARLAPFGLIYAVAAAHLVACLILSWPALRQRISLAVPAGESGVPIDLRAHELAAAAGRARLRLRWTESERAGVLSRHRFAPLGTVVSHGALLLLPLALAASRATRFRGDAWIVEGHAFGGTRDEYVHVEPGGDFAARAPDVRFQVEAVEAKFWGRRLFFTDLRALVVPPGGRSAWMTLAQPLRLGGARVSIHGFNVTPSFELVRADGVLLESGDLNLRLFPPGAEDSFRLPPLPHRFWVRLRDADGGYAMTRPRLHVAVTMGKQLVAHGWRAPGEPIAFDGFRLTLPAVRRGGEIMVHRDLGYPLAWLALALLLAGAATRILLPSVRVWVRFEGGVAHAIVREDAFFGDPATILGRLAPPRRP
ncbi:MAG: cytochrome c biogenesis protein ResB [Myxococcota bacterium]